MLDEPRNGWDTVPAFVLVTVWGMAPMLNLAVWIGAVPVFPAGSYRLCRCPVSTPARAAVPPRFNRIYLNASAPRGAS
jgi:hypothetical protein